MSLAIKYETLEDARSRLRNSVVFYDGNPVYINEIDRAPDEANDKIFRVHCTPLPTGDGAPIRRYISSRNFDISAFEMGFTNHEAYGLRYYSRTPQRQWKQGLCGRNLTCTDIGGRNQGVGNFSNWLKDKDVASRS